MEKKICTECGQERDLYKFHNGYKKDSTTRKFSNVCHHCRYRKRLEADPLHLRKRDLKKKYGITIIQFQNAFDRQKNSCAICGEKNANYVVDHDHSCCSEEVTCGKCIRGILCQKCNRGIGQFNDDIEKLKRAIEYLKNYK